MSIYADDVVNFTSVLKIAYNFLTGRDYLQKKKSKERKTLVSVASGFPDLVFAADSIPVFPIRMEKFKLNLYLLALNSATSLFGWNLTTKLLGIAKQIDFLKIVDNVLNDVINNINSRYNSLYDLAIQKNVSTEYCFGVKSIYGMHVSEANNCDYSLNFTIRCNKYNKYLKSLRALIPNQIWVEIPSMDKENEETTLEIMVNNLQKAITELENITGNMVNDNSLKKQFRIGNQVKRYYKTIIHDISTSNFYPCNPATFAEILALLTISFQDYNSNAQRYLENISQLVKEMRERINRGVGMEVSNRPRILLTPIFNGWEPEAQEIVYNLGGRVIYSDWDLLGLLEEISVSKNSDPIEEYAQFLLNSSNKGLFCLNNCEVLINSYQKYVKRTKVDGLIINQLEDCHINSACYDLMKNKIRTELRIPSTNIKFKKIGENMEQTKAKLSSFMELYS
ncbi:MAG: 2-hydroxyacyl-CoA dehydratase [Candidatus Lokiarchaeota archaeon]|nr:2-hydroxyacyl-CoA dehydratase [Candidatus Lokiarchaeota archaeon]